MDNPYTNRLWKTSGNSPGFNLGYYTSDKEGAAGSQVLDSFKQFKANRMENMHWADYVRANPGLEAHYQANFNSNTDKDGNPKPATLSRWDWGQQHYENYGQYEGPNNTTPTLSSSRLSTIARILFSNSTSSPDCTFVSP